MGSKRDLMVGVFFVIGLGLLFMLSSKVDSEGRIFGSGKVYKPYVAKFRSAQGLKVGDSVYLAGIRAGRLKAIDLLPNAVRIQFEIEDQHKLYAKTPVSIASTSLLGGRRLSLGLAGPPEERGDEIDWGGELENIKQGDLMANITEAFGTLTDVVKENRENLQTILANVRQTTDQLNKTGSVIGNLLNDQEMGANLRKTFARVEAISEDIKKIAASIRKDLEAGKGLLVKLLRDEEVSKKFDQIVEGLQAATKNIKDITAKINDPDGKGLIPRLIHDTALADSVSGMIEKIRETVGEVEKLVVAAREGKGTIGRLIQDPAIFENVKKITDDVKEMVAKVKRGEGSLGQLLASDEVADNLNRLLRGAGDAIEDAREQAPISAFGTVLLGGLQ